MAVGRADDILRLDVSVDNLRRLGGDQRLTYVSTKPEYVDRRKGPALQHLSQCNPMNAFFDEPNDVTPLRWRHTLFKDPRDARRSDRLDGEDFAPYHFEVDRRAQQLEHNLTVALVLGRQHLLLSATAQRDDLRQLWKGLPYPGIRRRRWTSHDLVASLSSSNHSLNCHDA
jgi:hypothetical protein